MTDVKATIAASLMLLLFGSLTAGSTAAASPCQVEYAVNAGLERSPVGSLARVTLALQDEQQADESEVDAEDNDAPAVELENEDNTIDAAESLTRSSDDAPSGDATPSALTAGDAATNETNGFLPTRGSIMLDFVFLAMLLILPVMQFSIYQAQRKNYRLHRTIQIGTAIALLAAVVLFELDMRLYTDWRKLADPSALYDWCTGLLYFHLCFAVPTPFIWGWVIYGAMRNLDANFQGSYSVQHRLAGKIAALLMYGTGLTGILFYVVIFVL